jgi:hypothetical protein
VPVGTAFDRLLISCPRTAIERAGNPAATHVLERCIIGSVRSERCHRRLFKNPALPAALLLAGCATLAHDMESVRSSWYGVHLDEVMARWGAPARRATLTDGREVFSWESVGAGGFPSPGSVGVYGGSGMGIGLAFGLPSPGSEPRRCERTFVFSGDRVVEQTWLGHPGFCSTFRREQR